VGEGARASGATVCPLSALDSGNFIALDYTNDEQEDDNDDDDE
jgi:hypothetical protein